jgi:CRP-like cAMP-binding protein
VIVLLSGRAKVSSLSSTALRSSPRSATVTTLEPVDALVVPRLRLRRLPRASTARGARHAENGRRPAALRRRAAGRLRHSRRRRTRRASARRTGRAFRAAGDGGIEIELPLSQEELAGWTGASREAVSKALQLLRSLRLIETGRRHVTVLDLEALRRHAQ